jgi:hypothetical protein
MRKSIALLVVVIGVTACAAQKEIPGNAGEGSDLMRESPCVCKQLEFDGRGFKWVG